VTRIELCFLCKRQILPTDETVKVGSARGQIVRLTGEAPKRLNMKVHELCAKGMSSGTAPKR
jgi:hypothetical protein